MSLQEVIRQYRLIDKSGDEVYPFVPELIYEEAIASSWNEISISANASDESIAISDIGTIKILELKVLPDDKSKITVKYNGVNESYSVNPIEITSENISSITASNSSSAVVKLYWRAIYA